MNKMLNIERSSFICIVSQAFGLDDYEVSQLETIVSKYYTTADKNWMTDKSRIYIDQVVFGALYWIKKDSLHESGCNEVTSPELDMGQVKEFVSLLYEDETRVQRNIEAIPRMTETLKNRYGDLKNIKIEPSLTLNMRFGLIGYSVPYDGLLCGQ